MKEEKNRSGLDRYICSMKDMGDPFSGERGQIDDKEIREAYRHAETGRTDGDARLEQKLEELGFRFRTKQDVQRNGELRTEASGRLADSVLEAYAAKYGPEARPAMVRLASQPDDRYISSLSVYYKGDGFVEVHAKDNVREQLMDMMTEVDRERVSLQGETFAFKIDRFDTVTVGIQAADEEAAAKRVEQLFAEHMLPYEHCIRGDESIADEGVETEFPPLHRAYVKANEGMYVFNVMVHQQKEVNVVGENREDARNKLQGVMGRREEFERIMSDTDVLDTETGNVQGREEHVLTQADMAYHAGTEKQVSGMMTAAYNVRDNLVDGWEMGKIYRPGSVAAALSEIYPEGIRMDVTDCIDWQDLGKEDFAENYNTLGCWVNRIESEKDGDRLHVELKLEAGDYAHVQPMPYLLNASFLESIGGSLETDKPEEIYNTALETRFMEVFPRLNGANLRVTDLPDLTDRLYIEGLPYKQAAELARSGSVRSAAAFKEAAAALRNPQELTTAERISEVSVMQSGLGKRYIRCKIDGEQQGAVPLKLKDQLSLGAGLTTKETLAASYFKDRLEDNADRRKEQGLRM